MDALFDPGEPIPTEEPAEAKPARERKPDEQSVIVWEDVPPEMDMQCGPSDEAWVHDPDCKCGDCVKERKRLAAVRKAQYKARCEAERLTVDQRIRMYRARARKKLPLFERGPREKRKA